MGEVIPLRLLEEYGQGPRERESIGPEASLRRTHERNIQRQSCLSGSPGKWWTTTASSLRGYRSRLRCALQRTCRPPVVMQRTVGVTPLSISGNAGRRSPTRRAARIGATPDVAGLYCPLYRFSFSIGHTPPIQSWAPAGQIA